MANLCTVSPSLYSLRSSPISSRIHVSYHNHVLDSSKPLSIAFSSHVPCIIHVKIGIRRCHLVLICGRAAAAPEGAVSIGEATTTAPPAPAGRSPSPVASLGFLELPPSSSTWSEPPKGPLEPFGAGCLQCWRGTPHPEVVYSRQCIRPP